MSFVHDITDEVCTLCKSTKPHYCWDIREYDLLDDDGNIKFGIDLFLGVKSTIDQLMVESGQYMLHLNYQDDYLSIKLVIKSKNWHEKEKLDPCPPDHLIIKLSDPDEADRYRYIPLLSWQRKQIDMDLAINPHPVIKPTKFEAVLKFQERIFNQIRGQLHSDNCRVDGKEIKIKTSWTDHLKEIYCLLVDKVLMLSEINQIYSVEVQSDVEGDVVTIYLTDIKL